MERTSRSLSVPRRRRSSRPCSRRGSTRYTVCPSHCISFETYLMFPSATSDWCLFSLKRSHSTTSDVPTGSNLKQTDSEGININITLLFSQQVYEDVVEAYLAGLEHLVARGGDPSKIAKTAVPSLDRTGLQGGAQYRRVSADNLRRRRRCPSARPQIYLRGRQGFASTRRSRCPGRA